MYKYLNNVSVNNVNDKTKGLYVSYAPKVNEKINNKNYWIKKHKDPNNIIMEGYEIKQLNELFYAEKVLCDIINNKPGNSMENSDEIRYGICVNRANIKYCPETKVVSSESEDAYFDEFQLTIARINTPVLIDGENDDGCFYHVIMNDYEGWAEKQCIAVCRSKEEWLQAQQMAKYLIITAPILRIEETGTVLSMGTKLRLLTVDEALKKALGRSLWNCYTVEIPVIGKDGYYDISYTLIPADNDVSIGFVPYTYANMLELAFKFNGNCYGWGGMHESVDCSQLIQELFACFGINLPRNASQQANLPVSITELSSMDSNNRAKHFDMMAEGSLLFFPGHIMLYLGKNDTDCFVINAVGSAVIPNESISKEKYEVTKIRSIIVNSLSLMRKNGNTWFNEITKAILIK